MTSSPSILLVGIPADHPSIFVIFPNHDPAALNEALKNAVQACHDAGYTGVQIMYLTPEKDGLKLFREELEKKKWDGVCIGFGVRGNPVHTEFFEQLVQTTIEVDPTIKLSFNANPPSTLAAVQRNFSRVA